MSVKILGESPAIKDLLKMIERVAATKTNVLIIGESGTGKELVARMIHESGPLKNKNFIPVNCGAIPENLIESEMFGHKKGSFTGAVSDKTGLFEAANSGSIFLDEVGELPLSMQVKLLRALQERSIRKVGGTDDISVDVRIISATNRDLEEAIHKGTFREDFYYRLNVILIRTPPLRERKSDIPLLMNHFLKKFAERFKKPLRSVSPEAMEILQAYNWPGNVRELENVIERSVALEAGDELTVASLPPALVGESKIIPRRDATVTLEKETNESTGEIKSEIRIPAPDFSAGAIDLDEILGNIEKTYLLNALEHSGGVKKKAAELLGITFRSIRYRLKKLGVESGDKS